MITREWKRIKLEAPLRTGINKYLALEHMQVEYRVVPEGEGGRRINNEDLLDEYTLRLELPDDFMGRPASKDSRGIIAWVRFTDDSAAALDENGKVFVEALYKLPTVSMPLECPRAVEFIRHGGFKAAMDMIGAEFNGENLPGGEDAD